MLKRQQFTYKLESDFLRFKEWNADDLGFREAMDAGMIVAVADTQCLKTIREIVGRTVQEDEINALYDERDVIKGRKGKKKQVQEIQQKIYEALFAPEYVTVVMNGDKDYDYLHANGFRLGGRKYREFNSSASQARVRTVAFLAEDIYDEVLKRLNCGRKMDEPLVPAKFSAYLGLSCSSIKEVTWPRIAIVKDYCEVVPTEVDYVIEQPENCDDKIERRFEDLEFNRFDGSGLISPNMASLWAADLALDYIPAQFCVRCSFVKGMVNVFDWTEWIEDRGVGFDVFDIYGEEVDLRNVDVILTESQVKLWQCWSSTANYVDSCKENGIVFGVSLWTPKEDKKHLTLNYQFIQTLNMTDEDISELCEDTVKYLRGVSVDDLSYTKLFLLGEKQNIDSAEAFLRSGEDWWIKSLLVEPSLFNDKYTKQRIRETIIKRIEQAACGKIMVPGNFQVIVPDPVAFMEALFKLPVIGLLGDGEAYSKFWIDRGSEIVDTMRSPLTNYSEHYLVNIISPDQGIVRWDQAKKYYRYSSTGFIINAHGNHTLRWAGSDYDYDIIASTDSPVLIRSCYKDLVPIIGKPLKGKKILFTDEDRFKANKMTFGSKIGRLTNLASAMCCLRADFCEGEKEHILLTNRLKSCCVYQNRQIDRAKAGVEVKSIPEIWTKWNKPRDGDTQSEEDRKVLYNACLVDKHPYFFKYVYLEEKIHYNKYLTAKDKVARIKFGLSMKELLARHLRGEVLSAEQEKFISIFYRFNGFINSPSEMNRLCKHIESIDFEIRKKISDQTSFDYGRLMDLSDFIFKKAIYDRIAEKLAAFIKTRATAITDNYYNFTIEEVDGASDITTEKVALKDGLFEVCPDIYDLTNYMVRFFYEEKTSYSKSILWDVCGKQMYYNLAKNISMVFIPVADEQGPIEFIYKRYRNMEVALNVRKDL